MAEEDYGFASEHDAPIPYLERIRDYYQALGYGAPYRWAHYAEVPFAALKKPPADSRIGLVTTAAPYQSDKGDQGPGAPYNAAAKSHTSADDSNTWFPLPALRRLADAGRIGEVAPRFHGAPTDRSHRATIERDCPELLARLREDKVDAAILVAV